MLCSPPAGFELRRLYWPTKARTSLDFIVGAMGDALREQPGSSQLASAPLPPMPDHLAEAGYVHGVTKGVCLRGLVPNGTETFSRPDRLRAGDLALFVSDPDPRVMGKFFVGVRDAPQGGREFLFYASALRIIIAVPQMMLRHVGRTDFIRKPDGELVPAPSSQMAKRLAVDLGCYPDAEGIVVPAMSSAAEAVCAVGREIARRAAAYPHGDLTDDVDDRQAGDRSLPEAASLGAVLADLDAGTNGSR